MTQKTKVLLVFAPHGRVERKWFRFKRVGCDSDFFRSKITLFLEEHVVRGKKRAVLIHENSLGYDNFKFFRIEEYLADRVRLLKNLQIVLTEINTELEDEFRRTVWKGVSGYPKYWDWGFEDFVLRINKQEHGRIRILYEPQTAEAYLLSFEEKQSFLRLRSSPDLLQAYVDCLKMIGLHTLLRDRTMISLVDKLSAEDPDQVIIIPRGLMHHPMVALFDKDRYDLTYEVPQLSSEYVERFQLDEAYSAKHAKLFYKVATGELPEEALKEHAESLLSFVQSSPLLRFLELLQ